MANIREFLLSYSTQTAQSASTYPTIQNLLDEIAADLATTQTDAWRIDKMNDYLLRNWKWFASTKLHTTTLSTGQAVYGLTTDMRFENIKAVLVSDSSTLTTTGLWTEYTLGGSADEAQSQTYFKALHGVGLYPVPTSDEHANYWGVLYSPSVPHYSTASLSTVPNVLPDFLSGMKSFVKSEIAKSGAEPDVDLANNHLADAMEVAGEARLAFYKRQQHDKATRKSDYSSKWYRG